MLDVGGTIRPVGPFEEELGARAGEPVGSGSGISIRVGGRIHKGWMRFGVELGIDNIAHGFELEVSDSWTEEDGSESARWTIETGDACEILLDGERLFSGWIDAVAPSLDAETHDIRIRGRAQTADLVDCSAIHTPGSWSGRKVEQIVEELIKPFSIALRVEAATGAALAKFALQPAEPVFEAITRLCQMRGLLAWSEDGATLIIGHPKAEGAPILIQEGKQGLRFDAVHDASERYSDYIVKGQHAGSDQVNGKAASGPKGSARDPAIKRNRPYMVIAEDIATAAGCTARAQWEASVRAAKSQTLDLTSPGLEKPGGGRWTLRQAVTVKAPTVRVEGAMMVASIRYARGAENGSETVLSLAYPAAYSPAPIAADASAARIGKKGKAGDSAKNRPKAKKPKKGVKP